MKKVNLSIPTPCHEDWDHMKTEDKGRFCSSCNKTVIDFTNMSDHELATFFKHPPSSVCGHLYADQLNRNISLPRKRIPWVRYFFQITLPAFLISMKANGQKLQHVQVGNHVHIENFGTKGLIAVHQVKELKQKPVNDQPVKINPDRKKEIIDYSYLPFVIDTINEEVIKGNISSVKKANVDNSFQGLIGSVTVTVVKKIKNKNLKIVPLIKQWIDTAFATITIFPDPVIRGTSFTIRFNKTDGINFIGSLITINGTEAQRNKFTMESREQKIDLNPDLAAGVYIFKLQNKNSGKYYTKKIIIQ